MTAFSQFPEILAGFPAACLPEDAGWDAMHAAAAAGGDRDAFRRLVERHSPALQRFCRHCLGSAADAEDICQETFVRAWHALPRYRESGQFRPWLWRIALNLCHDHARARQSRQRWLCEWPTDDPPDALSPLHESPDAAAETRAALRLLARGLALLPEKLRTPLVLSAIEQLPHQEIAVVLGTSVRAVDSRVFRARQRLAKWWQQQE